MTHLIGFDVFSVIENKIRAVFITMDKSEITPVSGYGKLLFFSSEYKALRSDLLRGQRLCEIGDRNYR